MNIKKILTVIVLAIVVLAGIVMAGSFSAPEQTKDTSTSNSGMEPQTPEKDVTNVTGDMILSVSTDTETDTPDDTFEIVQESGAISGNPVMEQPLENKPSSSLEKTEDENSVPDTDDSTEPELPAETDEIKLPVVPF